MHRSGGRIIGQAAVTSPAVGECRDNQCDMADHRATALTHGPGGSCSSTVTASDTAALASARAPSFPS